MTRVWEFEDNKAIPSDLVREQDFILRVRRMQRLGTPHTVVNLVLNALDPLAKSRRALEAMQEPVCRKSPRSPTRFMPKCRTAMCFMIWEKVADAERLISQLVAVMPAGRTKAKTSASFF